MQTLWPLHTYILPSHDQIFFHMSLLTFLLASLSNLATLFFVAVLFCCSISKKNTSNYKKMLHNKWSSKHLPSPLYLSIHPSIAPSFCSPLLPFSHQLSLLKAVAVWGLRSVCGLGEGAEGLWGFWGWMRSSECATRARVAAAADSHCHPPLLKTQAHTYG